DYYCQTWTTGIHVF
nr:immunoglobulin light chain junction region [Macaca mulatta]